MNIAQRGLRAIIRVYQVTLSPVLAAVLGPASHCRFQPTCSRYAVEAIEKHGAFAGGWLAARRLARCHPWGKFGADPVPENASGVEEFRHCHHGS